MADSRHSAPAENVFDSVRFSETSVHQPRVVSASQNPAGRKSSTSTEVSPMSSQNKLVQIQGEDEMAIQDDEAQVPSQLATAEFIRRSSSAEPAGSSMPPPETAFLTEKEVVDPEPQSTPRIDKTGGGLIEIISVDGTARRPANLIGARERQPDSSSKDATAGLEEDTRTYRTFALVPARSSFSSTTSSMVESQADAEDRASVIFQAARQAHLKRPSLVNHPAAGGSGIQLANLAHFIKAKEVHNSIGSSAIGEIDEDRNPIKSTVQALNKELVLDDQLSFEIHDRLGEPQTMTSAQNRASILSFRDPMSLQDALRLNPVDPANMPKRSATLPSSLGSKRKTRFAPLSITANGAGKFRRDSIVTTPYPKRIHQIHESPSRDQSGALPSVQGEFSLRISARNCNRSFPVPEVSPLESKGQTWWTTKEVDDEKLIKMAKAGYSSIQGKLRHIFGAKTAKSIRLRFIRSDRSEHLQEPDSPLIGSRWNACAEGDFWGLWLNPVGGRGKRDWLDVLTNHSKIYGASRTFVLEIVEGYDALRIILAFASVTALSLIAMFLWLFLGVSGKTGLAEGTLKGSGDGVEPFASSLTTLNSQAAFIFGIWILTLGWTFVGAWILIS